MSYLILSYPVLSYLIVSFLILDSIDELIIKIDLYDKEMGNISATIGDSALTENAIHGFREILKNCKVNLMKKEIKVVNTNSGGSDVVMLKVLSDKDIPFFNLLRMALSSVCLDKYSVMNEKNINTDFNNKRKANRISESVTASASTHFYPGIFAQKRNVRTGYVILR